MEKISACIITYNEEAVIKECIESVAFADEVIVVDSHSTDKTRDIAVSLGAKVVEHPFKSHIDQKNYALTLANNDWVISLDADERVTESLRDEIKKTFSNGNLQDGYRFKRKTNYLNRWIGHGGWYPDRHLRLFKRSKSKWDGKNPHDRIYCNGEVKNLKSDITHYSFSSLSSHIKTIDNFSGIMARELYKRKKSSFVFIKLVTKPIWKFIEMYLLKRGFMDGREGFIISVYSAFSTFAKFSKLYEIKKIGFDGNYKD